MFNQITSPNKTRVGVFVDAANMLYNGGGRLQYAVLRDFACRDGAEAVRLNVYVSYDAERARQDPTYRARSGAFHAKLRDQGFKINLVPVKWRQLEHTRIPQANADADLVADAMLQSEMLDRVLLATGDGDFARLVQILQDRGRRVEVVGVDNVAGILRNKADLFLSAYLIPNLVPVENDEDGKLPAWGEIGSRVRGWCYWMHESENYGFFRFLKCIPANLWVRDYDSPESPYEEAFFHLSKLPSSLRGNIQPSQQRIFEFTLIKAEKGNKPQAVDITLVSGLPEPSAAVSTGERA